MMGEPRKWAGSVLNRKPPAVMKAKNRASCTGAVCFGTAFGSAAAFDDPRLSDLSAVLRGGVL